MNAFVDQSGRQVSLGPLIGRGGEGSVYRVPVAPDSVAKIYHAPLSYERAEKLRSMIRLGTPEINNVCAWPTGQILTAKALKGFTMPFMPNRKELHVLHGPKSRKAEFPEASFGFLIHVACNIARAFAVLHSKNIIVGDVNDRGIMVGRDGTVRLIDCDSFQFTASSKEFLCDVGTPGFTPPELQGRHLRGLRRTAAHDNFGLAVLIFLLLFMGRHPFAGRYAKGQIEPEIAIKEYRYAYSSQTSRTLMTPPPNTIAIERAVNPSLVDLFERAFGPPTGIHPQRPTALDWVEALSGLQRSLVVCKFNKAHEFGKSLSACPWCDLEQRSGIDLFNFIDTGSEGPEVDLEPIWRAICGLAVPSVPEPLDERALGRLQGCGPPPDLVEKAELLNERKEEYARARRVAEALNVEAARKLLEAEELKNEITSANPDVLKLLKAIARNEQPIFRSPLFVGTWSVAMLYFAAAFAFSPEYAILGFGLLIFALPALVVYRQVRHRKVVLLREDLEDARAEALKADPHRFGQVVEIEKAAEAASEGARSAEAVADAIDKDCARLRDGVTRAKAELKKGLWYRLQSFEAELAAEKATLDRLRARSQELHQEYAKRTASLQNGLTQWRQLKAHRDDEIRKLRAHDRESKLEVFLDGYFIAQADISGITPALKAALASFGIETAADIDETRVRSVQGFGPKRTAKMVAWRRSVASKFVYIPNQTVDPQKLRAIHQRFSVSRRKFERDFQVALTDLQEKTSTLATQVQPAISKANEAIRKAAQVRADIQALDAL